MKRKILGLFIVAIIIFSTNTVYAHPGRTDSNGCHTCRTNCERWGLRYGQYHCHNGSGTTQKKSYVYGCTDPNAMNYNSNANVNDGSCIAKVYGCTDSNAVNYNSNANINDGSCIAKVYGCTDKEAYNYDHNANTDNGSCIAKVYGCQDNMANNYNYKANMSDGSCLYTKYKIKYKKIKYKIKYKNKLFSKNGTIIRKGKNGKKKIITKYIVNENGDTTKKYKDKIKIIKKPVNKLIVNKKK